MPGAPRGSCPAGHCGSTQGTQFTCLTSTKVQILTPEELRGSAQGTQFTCVTSTKVQILTRAELRGRACLHRLTRRLRDLLGPHSAT